MIMATITRYIGKILLVSESSARMTRVPISPLIAPEAPAHTAKSPVFICTIRLKILPTNPAIT